MISIESTADFRRLVIAGKTRESLGLEFKADIPRRQSPDANERRRGRHEFARDLAQFANADGGCVLIGVNEQDLGGVKVAGPIRPLNDFDAVCQVVEQTAQEFLVPSTMPMRVLPIELDMGFVAAVNVPPCRHLVWVWDRQSHTMECLRRTNQGKEWMNPDEAERHMMNASRAAKLEVMEASRRLVDTSSVGSTRVQLCCDLIASIDGELVPVENVTVFLGRLSEQELSLDVAISYGERSTLNVPYQVVTAAWVTADRQLGLMLAARVIASTNSFLNPVEELDYRTRMFLQAT